MILIMMKSCHFECVCVLCRVKLLPSAQLQSHHPYHPWRLSPTIENSGSEEQSALLRGPATSGTATTSTAASTPSTIIGGIPAADRTKYEKFGTNDITSDDDDGLNDDDDDDHSGSELFHDDAAAAAAVSRKPNFKQIVANNLHDKIQAVYGKVDKTQVIVTPIVRKIKQKTSLHHQHHSLHGKVAKVSGKGGEPKGGATSEPKREDGASNNADGGNNSDNDSIGSASDLQKTDETTSGGVTAMMNSQICGGGAGNAATLDGSANQSRRGPKKLFDDAISESVRTCGSSAYHAECESVATNEDDISRVQVRVRMKKRDRLTHHHTTDDVIDEAQMSPSSADLLHQFGDRPLLLDDELDYDSSDPTTESKGEEEEDEEAANVQPQPHAKVEEELDVFAMAPFKMPTALRRHKPPKPADAAWTSTPHKTDITSPPVSHAFADYAHDAQQMDVSPAHQAPAPPRAVLIPTPISVVETATLNPFLRPEVVATVHKSFTQITSELVADQVATSQRNSTGNAAAFVGSLAAPMVEPNNNVHGKPALSSVVTVNQSIVIDRFTPTTNSEPLLTTSPHEFVNFAHVKNAHDFARMPEPRQEQQQQLPVVAPTAPILDIPAATSSRTKAPKEKRDKTSSKYTALKDDEPPARGESARVAALPAILVAKVKGNNPLSYKKVVTPGGRAAKRQADQPSVAAAAAMDCAPGTVQHEYQIGFNNMSFEDFPSDQEMDILNPSDGASRTKTTPFEVVRNEKMLQEAERKFGSLKRRSNMFSS